MSKIKYILISLCFLIFIGLSAKAQLAIQDFLTDSQLVQQILLGEGVQVYNITSSAAPQAIGQFTTGSSIPELPMSSGIILSTGNIFHAIGPNIDPGTSTNNGRPGDSDIESIMGGVASFDAAIIEFDFRTPADTVRFNYIFASEEYREYVCSFNDAFAFFLSGPNPLGGDYSNHNIALLPGTTTNVSISNVNNGSSSGTCPWENSNSEYYVDNPVGSLNVEYDGLTKLLTAIAVVVPCQEYHIKIVIADAFDSAYDSAVFLEANSLGAIVDTIVPDFVHDGPGCTGKLINFINAGQSGPTITYEWTFNGPASIASSTDENPSVSWSAPGLYQVDFSIIYNCNLDTAKITKYVNVYENPSADFTFTTDVCQLSEVQFTNTGSSGDEYTHEWIFTVDANPSVSYAENPSVIFTTPGNKLVRHIVSNDHCTTVYEDYINITAGPIASFAHNGPLCLNQTIDFTNTGTSFGVSFEWSFGPNGVPNSSTNENPTGVSFTTAGTQIISLTLTDLTTGCIQTYVSNVQVFNIPVADFSFIDNVCIGTGVDFTNTGSSGSMLSYSWNFGSNASPGSSYAENPENINFNNSGAHSVTLTVSNQSCSSTITQVINVENSPAPEISFSSNAPNCNGVPIDFSFDLDPTNLDFNWDFGPNATPPTSTDVNPAGIVFNSFGSQLITLTVTNQISACFNSQSQSINLYETPSASFSFTDSVCVSSLVDFTNTGSSGQEFSYLWDFGSNANPNSSGIENPAGVSFNTNGQQIITLTVTTPHCVSTVTNALFIKNSPAPVIDFASTAPVCENNNITFSINSFDSSLDYSWDFGINANPTTSTAQQPVVVYNNDGIMTVQLFVTDPLTSCSNYVEKTIQVYPIPNVNFTSSAPVCIGESVSFYNTGSIGESLVYSWDFGSGATPNVSNAQNPNSIIYTSSGEIEVSLTISSNECSNTIVRGIEIYPGPIVDFTTNAPLCTGKNLQMHNLTIDDGNATYQWTFDGNASISSSTDEEPNLEYTDPGLYGIHLIVTNISNSCTDSLTRFINVYQTPVADFSSNDPVCPNEEINFVNEGSTGDDYTYSWSFGRYGSPHSSLSENPTGISFSQGGTQLISFFVSNNNCFAVSASVITLHDLPFADAGQDTIICANRTVLIGSPEIAGYSYFWSPANFLENHQIANPLAVPIAEFTNYYLTVIDTSTTCVNYDTVTITMMPMAIALTGPDISMCLNDSVQIGAGEIQGQSYYWTPATGISDQYSPNPIVNATETTIYTLSVAWDGCDTVTDQVKVKVHPLPIIKAGEDQTIAQGESTHINATGGVSYLWSPNEFINNTYLPNPSVNPDDTITYIVIGTDVHGCQGMDSVTIFVKEALFYIPNSFTPNNDGRNDVFYIRGNPIENFQLQIFNRLNQSVFITRNFYEGWNGTIQNSGDKCVEGAYVYIVTGIDEQGEDVVKSGIINLIR
ncbi:MAG: choice-of-anchor L domain-containing protein [Bacteroidales bacterium]|nr:choice-of-anchor L domain-containing protein [Bacteroidales bacterium]